MTRNNNKSFTRRYMSDKGNSCKRDRYDLNTIKFQRIYFVEFLRVLFISSVILLHLLNISPQFAYFHTKSFHLAFSVDFFFIIGGFFLYREIVSHVSLNTTQLIGKRWIRLAPNVICCYIILLLAGIQYWGYFPYALSLTMSCGFGPLSVAGGPDWYVGVYFLVSCFFLALFKKARDLAWIYVILVIAIGWCIQVNLPLGHGLDTRDMYYSILYRHVVRGLTCMGIGMVASYLSMLWHGMIIRGGGILFRSIMTLLEAVATAMILFFLFRRDHMLCGPVAVEMSMAMLLISAANNWGYITKFFNRISIIQYISRYCYSLLVCHGVTIALFKRNKNFAMDPTSSVYVYLIATIIFTLLEYHLIERFLVPKIKAYLSRDQKEEISREANS